MNEAAERARENAYYLVWGFNKAENLLKKPVVDYLKASFSRDIDKLRFANGTIIIFSCIFSLFGQYLPRGLYGNDFLSEKLEKGLFMTLIKESLRILSWSPVWKKLYETISEPN